VTLRKEAQATSWTLNVKFAEDKCTYAQHSGEKKAITDWFKFFIDDFLVSKRWLENFSSGTFKICQFLKYVLLNCKSLMLIGENGE
jgi:hypothetical protein